MPTSLGDLCCAGKIPGKLSGFLCKENVQYLGNDSKDISHIPEFHFCDKFHDKDEHPTGREESASGVNAVARCDSASDVNARRTEKGKEKVIYNNSKCVSNTKKSNDSIESIESCLSTKATKRKNVEYSAANISSRNKRCRREDNESSCSGICRNVVALSLTGCHRSRRA
jgi:hypothetical protein